MITEVKKLKEGFMVGNELIEESIFKNYVEQQGKTFGIYEKKPLYEVSDGYKTFDEANNSLCDFIGKDLIVCVYDFNIDRFLVESLRKFAFGYCSSLPEAMIHIGKLEINDKKNGIFIEGFYRVIDLLDYSRI